MPSLSAARSRPFRSCLGAFLALWIWTGAGAGTGMGTAVAAEFPEYLIKAQLLIRLAEFVEWPAGSFHSPCQPFVIGIVGPDPFGDYLDTLAQKEQLGSHPIQLRRLGPADPELARCHMVFLAVSTTPQQQNRVLARIGSNPVLTVGDANVMTQRGCHIGFLVVEDRIRFHINLKAARRNRLVFPSQLLRLAAHILDDAGR